jgi:hypothetical protein
MTVKMTLDPRTMPDGVILALHVRYGAEEGDRPNPTIYTHAAVKSAGFWYLSGSRAPQIAGWGAVERWLEKDRRELVRVEILTRRRTIWPEPVAVVQDEIDPGTEPSYYLSADDRTYGTG